MPLCRQDFILERPKVKQKSFAAHTRHPEPVLSIVLNAAQGWAMYGILTMGQQWLQISNLKR